MSSNNKTLLTIAGIAVVVLILFGGIFLSTYNGLVDSQENVDASWAQVENQYQRRADLIPNLVETVKGFASQEKELLENVAKYRSQWAAAKNQNEQIDAAKGMDSAISRLLVVVENYPQLKSNENFLALQAQLEGTENRIAVERMRYNEAVKEHNTKIKKIPSSIIANMYGFEERVYFEAERGTEDAPKVNFGGSSTTPIPKSTTIGSDGTSSISSSSVQLHGDKTDVALGEEIVFKLSAVNLINKPVMKVQIILIPPSGMSVTSADFVTSGAGQYSTTYNLEPGGVRDIEVRLKTNQVGDFNVKGKILYYYGDDISTTETYILDTPVKVRTASKKPGAN